VRTAADRTLWVLRARAQSSVPATLQTALDDLTALHEELAARGHHSDLVTPTPYLLLASHTRHPIRICPSGPCFYWSPDLTIGDRDQIPTTALNLAWALNTGPHLAH
jgi:hypothetical protein